MPSPPGKSLPWCWIAPREREALPARSAESTQLLLDALREAAADASARGTAFGLLLVLYGRMPVDSLRLDGDRRVFDQLVAWEPDE